MYSLARAASPSPGRNRIRGLDGIRAFAFLLVLAGHCGVSWIPNGFGVTIFFFLSGFLITTLLRQEWIQHGSISIRKFYIRRAFRILPPLAVAIAFAVVLGLTGIIHSEVHWSGVAAVLLFFTNYAESPLGLLLPVGLSVLWSLAVEEHFYLIFPWIYRWMLNPSTKRPMLLLSCICILELAWRTARMVVFHTSWYGVYSGTDTRLDSILFGSMMAIAANPVIDRLDGMSRRKCAIGALLGVVILITTIAIRNEILRQTIRYSIQGVAFFPIFVYIVRYRDSFVTRTLDLKVLTHIGDLSYSLYVIHYTVLFAVKEWMHTSPAVMLLATFFVSYILALTMHRYVELTSNKVRNRLLIRLAERHLRPATLSITSQETPLAPG